MCNYERNKRILNLEVLLNVLLSKRLILSHSVELVLG